MHHRRQSSAHKLANGLGWFSIALGAAEVFAPRTLGRMLGMERQSGLIQAFGMREIATGIAVLSMRDPAPGLWGRVGGDALDIAALAPGLSEDNPKRGNVGLALGTVVGVTLLDLLCASALGQDQGPRRPVRDYSDRSGFPNGLPQRARPEDLPVGNTAEAVLS